MIFVFIVLLKLELKIIVILFFFGATCPGREQVSFVYMCELVPEKHRTYIGSVLLFLDATTVGLVSVYFRFISKNWLYFQYVSVGLNFIAVIALLFIPESPKLLHSKGDFAGSKKILVQIAKFNKQKSYDADFKFEQEMITYKE